MALNNKAVFLSAIGGVFLYAAASGFSVLKAIQNVIQGKPASEGQTDIPIAAGIGTGTSGGTVAPSGPGEKAWWTAMLASMAAPPTAANLTDLVAWRTKECPWNNQPPDGATYTHNPLNTTLKMPGSKPINSVGVQKYPASPVGMLATVRTLTSGYPHIVSALRSGKGLHGPDVASDFLKWSGGAYSGV